MLFKELFENNSPGLYVYHASYLPDQATGLKSLLTKGLQPSKQGYAGPGVYFAYDPEGGYYHVSKEEATMLRVKWADLVDKFGVYPDNQNGIERDENEIIVPGTVPANMIEVEYFPGEWWDLSSAYHASLGPMDETMARPQDLLNEAATSIVYHYCGVGAAERILSTGNFQLSSVTGNSSEQQYAPPGYPYFLSTTRSRVGDYHRYAGNSAAMFVIDGNWLNQRYRTRPIDYWDGAWLHSKGTRTRESEDRVFSKTSEIPIGGVLAVHVLIKEANEYRGPEVRSLMISAKKRGIPAYLYTNENAWRLQDTRRAVSPKAVSDLLKGPPIQGYSPSRPHTMYLEPWLELIYKNKKADLTPAGEKLRYNLIYYGSRYQDEDSGLGNDMSNARKPSSNDYPTAVKINSYMRANKIPNTVALKNLLVSKWNKIK